jgi:26S proteasome regulatory subunit T5
VEILDLDVTAEAAEEGANIDLDATRVGKSAVIKTSTRQTIFLPLIGLVDHEKLKPGDLIGVNKDSYLILDTLPAEYDSRVKAMEVDEKPTEKYTDVGGLDKQIEELVEAVVWPMKEAERFKKIGIKAPKGKDNQDYSITGGLSLTIATGALMYGPPGTGKTLLARACAAQTDATFLKLAGPQLVQMFIGDGAKLVRDCFALAKEKAPSIIFIDELDAIGTKRFDSDKSGDREVQRTMLELLNQLDGFASDDRIKVLAATNRIDVLDPALLRSGRLDRKIEFPLPNEEARAQILRIHSRKMTVDDAVNWPELARSTDEFGGAQLKAVCVEAGMIALRKGQNKISHEHYVDAISEVQAKKKVSYLRRGGPFPLDVVLTSWLRTLSTSTLKQYATMTAQALKWCGCKTNGIEVRQFRQSAFQRVLVSCALCLLYDLLRRVNEFHQALPNDAHYLQPDRKTDRHSKTGTIIMS